MQSEFRRKINLLLIAILCALAVTAQDDLPKDYLSKEFHMGRREAARSLMPENSVMVVFAAPARTFSNDITYFFHQNPDLYYFTGYKEPNAVLFIFKEQQLAGDGQKFNELFFVQKRNALAEQWTGRRLGTEGVKSKLGIKNVYNGDDLKKFPLDLSKFNTVIFGSFYDDVADNPSETSDLYDLISFVKQKINLPADYQNALYRDLGSFKNRASVANIDRLKDNFKTKMEANEIYRNNALVKSIVDIKDSAGIEKVKSEIGEAKINTLLFDQITGTLRETKTPEELQLLRKAVEISCIGQNEVMKTVRPDMSELEVGIARICT